MKWRESLESNLSLVALTFFLIKGSFWTVGWSVTVGIVLVLIVHYTKSLVPAKQKTADAAQVIKALEDVEKLKSEVSTLKLAAGLKSKTGF